MGQDARPRYNDYRGHRCNRLGPPITKGRTRVRSRERGGAVKRRNHIEIVPVWRERVDHHLYVLALVAFAEQLARESQKSEPEGSIGGGDKEGEDD